ncbi:MAG: haloacid dehalogenase type II [Hyphomicrobiaceae bacterium]|nr:haloacid dehalogenase type II [Hyphomicrobiaceae bacterium]
MPHAPIFVFDAYGTLFDIHAPASRLAARLGPMGERMSEIWRTKQLEYTWVHAAAGEPATFWDLTERSLDYAIASTGLVIDDRTRADLLDAYRDLDAYPEVGAVLDRLAAAGARLAILSNGDPDMLERAVDSAGLAGCFAYVLSVADAGTFKPVPAVYRLAVEAFDRPPGDIVFCSSNRWDIAGAHAFGFETVWVNRMARPDEYPGHPPNRIVSSLDGVLMPEG